MRYLLAALVALTPSVPQIVGACQPYPSTAGVHALDGAYADDVTPPVIEETYVAARDAWSTSGCGDSKCGSPALVYMHLQVSDDRAPHEAIGYLLTRVSGTLPAGLVLPSGAVRGEAFADGSVDLGLPYSTDAAWSFELEIRAVDLNGNESAPVVVSVSR